MKNNPIQQVKPVTKTKKKSSLPSWLPRLAWGVAIFMVALMMYLLWQRSPVAQAALAAPQGGDVASGDSQPASLSAPEVLPPLKSDVGVEAIVRVTNPRTTIPTRPRSEPTKYTIQKGDSIFGIANQFKIKPESILWSNYTILNDDPHMISVGMELEIPPTDGVYYEWKESDTIEKVAATFKVDPESILEWPGNQLDITNPVIEPGTMIMIPGGSREFKQWVVPVAYAPKSGVTKGVSGPGGCQVSAGGPVGSGTFVWPAVQHFLSGNDYWSGHLAIDIAAGEGAPVYAADSGVVVYAGSIGGGYGNMVMIDHQNGYHTLYAHMSQISVYCGQGVGQGQLIGLAGSTGNSTGAHLHFEVRYLGGFINPWYVLQ
ncbi:MAG: M23 family metallopeptidase [Anaerolineae bacterium]|nr:M23 family metallopeptidase [Anaerolineae bacterium]